MRAVPLYCTSRGHVSKSRAVSLSSLSLFLLSLSLSLIARSRRVQEAELGIVADLGGLQRLPLIIGAGLHPKTLQ